MKHFISSHMRTQPAQVIDNLSTIIVHITWTNQLHNQCGHIGYVKHNLTVNHCLSHLDILQPNTNKQWWTLDSSMLAMVGLTCLRWAVTHHSSASWWRLTHIQRDMNMSHHNKPAASQRQCMLTQANNAKTNKIQVSSDIAVVQVIFNLCTSRLTLLWLACGEVGRSRSGVLGSM